MKKILALVTASFLISAFAIAQDDLLGELQKEDSAKVKQDIAIATFKSTRIVNMHSVEMTGVGNLQFMIIHHFGPVWSENESTGGNFARLLGVNGGVANTYMSFDYSPTTYMNLAMAFAGNATLEGTAKFKILRQQTGLHNYPLSIATVSIARYNASSTVPAENGLEWNKVSYLNQLLVARKFNDNFSLQFIGSWVHNNVISYGAGNGHEIFSVGMGGRMKLTHKTAITFEYSRQLNMYEDVIDKSGEIVSYSPNLISLGYDWDTGGHIFQFFLSNSQYASNVLQLSTNPVHSNMGQWSLGFNLNRSYSIKHTVKAH